MELFTQEVKNMIELKELLKDNEEISKDYEVAVIVYAFDKENKIIFQRRGPACRDERLKLETIGGRVKTSDIDFKTALNREIVEEVGTEANIEIEEFITGTYATTFDDRYKKEQNWIYLVYKGVLKSGELQIAEPSKCLGYERYKIGEVNESELSDGAKELYKIVSKKYNFLLGGENMKLVSINPSNNEILGEVEETTQKEVMDKITLAKSSQSKWDNLKIDERVELLKEIYNKFEENIDKIANLISLEMGKPISQAESEVKSTLKNIKWDLENAKDCIAPEITYESNTEVQKIFYEPKGIVVAISPFNYPFSLCCAIAFQNLIVGNVVISKPDQNVPILYKFLEELINNSNLPNGVWQIVFGGKEIGSFLVEQNIDMICFTGNTKTGEYLYKVAASKMIPILMELGGSAPGIVCEDANIDDVIEGIFKKKFSNSGQLCHALKRLIVHESIFDEVVNKLQNIAEVQMLGNPLDTNTTIGPLVNEKQINTLLEQFNDAVSKGAKVVCGGTQKEKYFEPTILTNITKNMKVWREEVFGPILPVVSFKTIEEAIELANDTIYGLGGYVFTTNQENFEKISKELKTGMVACNNLAYSAPYNPFGGVKKFGLGRTRGKWGLRGLCNIKVVTFENIKE